MVQGVFITEFGGSDKVMVGDVPHMPWPTAGEGEVLIKVHAAGINPVDWKIREGYLKSSAPHKFPLVLGWDLAGEVLECGHGTRRLKVGDKVWSFARRPTIQHGTLVEYMSLPESLVSLSPPSLSYQEAAAVPLTALTAYQGLFDAAKLQAGETIMIIGASGGVGSFAVQLAANAGATVMAVSSPKNHDYVRKLGAHHTFDYRDPNYLSEVRKAANGGAGVDVVFDAHGDPASSLPAARRPGARVVSIAGDIDDKDAAAAQVSFYSVFVEPNPAELDLLSRDLEAGKLTVHVHKSYPMKEAAKAMDDIRAGGHVGKLVLNIC